MKRLGMWAGGLVALALGCVVLGFLVALGPLRLIHLDTSVIALSACLGLFILVCGLAALWWRLMRRWWSRTLGLIIGLPLVVALASPFAIAMWASHPTHAFLEQSAPDGAEDLSIPCGDATLAAWVLEADSDSSVIVAHGSGSTRDDALAQALAVRDAGYTVVMYDARGHGNSTGSAMDLGWWGESDLGCVVDTLVSEYPGASRHVAVLGLSMGGEQAIGAAGADARIEAVIAEGATGRTAADKDGWLPQGPLGTIQRRLDGLRDLSIGILSDAPKPQTLRESASHSDAQFLLITAGTVDSEADAAAWIARGNSRVTVWTVERSDHVRGLATAPDEWKSRVIGFLEQALQ